MHYQRWQRHGNPEATSRIVGDDVARFWSYVVKSDHCWGWTGGLDDDDYGRLAVNRKNMRAHIYAYELLVEPVPDGLVLDHLCRNHRCVNPAHLEPVTDGENVLRGVGVTAMNAVKTVCDSGHEFTAENTYVSPRGWRKCRTCQRQWKRDHIERKRTHNQ